MNSYTVTATQSARYAKLFGRRNGDQPSHYETRWLVVDANGDTSWDCATPESAQRFADALNCGDDAEVAKLAEAALEQ